MTARTYDPVAAAQGRLPRPGRDGLPDGRPPEARRPPRHRLQPHRRRRPTSGSPSTAARSAPTPRAGRARRRASSSAASATTTTCAASCSASTAPSPACSRGAVFVDHTTASAEVARELARGGRSDHGLHFVDAPVSGGQAGAVNGPLTVMCGGDAGRLRARQAGRHGLRRARSR